MNGLLVFIEMKQFFLKKKIKMADSKNLIFQLRQFSIFFHEKNPKKCIFLPVFEHMSDSLTTI